VRVKHTFAQSRNPFADFLQEQFSNGFLAKIACGVMPDSIVCEKVRQIAPLAKFRVMTVSVLQELNVSDCFHAADAGFKLRDPVLKCREIEIGGEY
jgi:hypothetical protein